MQSCAPREHFRFETCQAVAVTGFIVAAKSYSLQWLVQVVGSRTPHVVPSSFHTDIQLMSLWR